MPARRGILPRMQSFGKRQFAHIEHDPWAKRKKPRQEVAPRERAIPLSRIAGYLVALFAVGVIAVASFEMLVLA